MPPGAAAAGTPCAHEARERAHRRWPRSRTEWAKRDSTTPTISRARGGCVPEVAYRVAYGPHAGIGRIHEGHAGDMGAAVPAGQGARWRHAAAHAAVTVTVRSWSNSRWLLGLLDGAAKD